jgi:hypothetical protein
MKRFLRSKWFWAAVVGKFAVSALVVSYIFPQMTEAAVPASSGSSAGKTWTFQAKAGLDFPVTFVVPQGWSMRWENRPGLCVDEACIQGTIELNPGYLYSADHVVTRQGSALKLVWIDKGSFGAGGDKVVDKLKEGIVPVKHKTWVNPQKLLTTRSEGKLQGIGTNIPTQDYVVLLNGGNEGMLFLSLEDTDKETIRVAEALVKSVRMSPK